MSVRDSIHAPVLVPCLLASVGVFVYTGMKFFKVSKLRDDFFEWMDRQDFQKDLNTLRSRPPEPKLERDAHVVRFISVLDNKIDGLRYRRSTLKLQQNRLLLCKTASIVLLFIAIAFTIWSAENNSVAGSLFVLFLAGLNTLTSIYAARNSAKVASHLGDYASILSQYRADANSMINPDAGDSGTSYFDDDLEIESLVMQR